MKFASHPRENLPVHDARAEAQDSPAALFLCAAAKNSRFAEHPSGLDRKGTSGKGPGVFPLWENLTSLYRLEYT